MDVTSKHNANHSRIDNNLRLSKITEEKHNLSVDGISPRGGKDGTSNMLLNNSDEDKHMPKIEKSTDP
jgi:hypothetical protein